MQTILFDLDGTLLPINNDIFFNNYLEILSEKMSEFYDKKIFIKKLLASTTAMIQNLEDKTNEQVFIEYFFKDVSENQKHLIMKNFQDFYETEFPILKNTIKENPHAKEIIEYLLSKNVDIIIATNPVFPLVAIKERLKWINIETFDYKLITSYEIMKYCKPQISYYKQIFSLTGADPANSLMVGNDVYEDLIISELGVQTFLIEDYLIDRIDTSYNPTYKGTFKDFGSYIFNKI